MLQDLKVLTVGRTFCAKLLRSSRCKRDNDQIDEGSTPVYSLWSRHVAQSRVYSPAPLSDPEDAHRGCPYVPGMLRMVHYIGDYRGVLSTCASLLFLASLLFRAQFLRMPESEKKENGNQHRRRAMGLPPPIKTVIILSQRWDY